MLYKYFQSELTCPGKQSQSIAIIWKKQNENQKQTTHNNNKNTQNNTNKFSFSGTPKSS